MVNLATDPLGQPVQIKEFYRWQYPVLTYAFDLWERAFNEIGAADYADIQRDYAHVDAATMWFVKNPEWFDVIVTDNMFGDIITDLGAMVQGGMGIADIVKITGYIVGKENFPAYAAGRKKALGEARPASTAIIVPALAMPQWLVEIEVIAAK